MADDGNAGDQQNLGATGAEAVGVLGTMSTTLLAAIAVLLAQLKESGTLDADRFLQKLREMQELPGSTHSMAEREMAKKMLNVLGQALGDEK